MSMSLLIYFPLFHDHHLLQHVTTLLRLVDSDPLGLSQQSQWLQESFDWLPLLLILVGLPYHPFLAKVTLQTCYSAPGLGCSSVGEHLPSMCKALGSSSQTNKTKPHWILYTCLRADVQPSPTEIPLRTSCHTLSTTQHFPDTLVSF